MVDHLAVATGPERQSERTPWTVCWQGDLADVPGRERQSERAPGGCWRSVRGMHCSLTCAGTRAQFGREP